MYGDMSALAFIELTEGDGVKLIVRIIEIDRIYRKIGGSQITLKAGGAPLDVNETPAQVYTAINTKWTEFTTALGDPT